MRQTPVGQGRNDEPFGAAEELVLVGEGHVGDADEHLVQFGIEVEAKLFHPIEVDDVLDALAAQLRPHSKKRRSFKAPFRSPPLIGHQLTANQ